MFQAGAHGLSGGIFNAIDGDSFGIGFLSSAAASAVGSGVDHLGINSVALYMAAEIAGGDFWRGAEQGVIATAYNHAVHGLYNKITQDSKSPYDGYRKDKNGNYIRVDGRGGDKIDYLYDEEGNIIASTPVSFTEIEVGLYRRTYGQGTKYVSPALYDPSFDIFAWWASGEVLGAAVVKTYRYLSGVAKGGTTVLGHYPAYTKLASKLGANRFEIPANVWNKMTAAEQWAANTKFLDRMILRGDNIRLATPLSKVKLGSFYQKELNYLFDKGYKVSSDGLWLVK